jgi:hypothetical protein
VTEWIGRVSTSLKRPGTQGPERESRVDLFNSCTGSGRAILTQSCHVLEVGGYLQIFVNPQSDRAPAVLSGDDERDLRCAEPAFLA